MPGYSCDDDTLNPQAQFYPSNIVVNKKWMLRLGSYKKTIVEHFTYLTCYINRVKSH